MIYQRFAEIFSCFDPSHFTFSQLILEFLSIIDSIENISFLFSFFETYRKVVISIIVR